MSELGDMRFVEFVRKLRVGELPGGGAQKLGWYWEPVSFDPLYGSIVVIPKRPIFRAQKQEPMVV